MTIFMEVTVVVGRSTIIVMASNYDCIQSSNENLSLLVDHYFISSQTQFIGIIECQNTEELFLKEKANM